MQQNYQTTQLPTVASRVASIAGANWQDINNILDLDSDYSWLGYFSSADRGANITGSSFGFNLPEGAFIDGISVDIAGLNVGCYGDVSIGIAGTTTKAIGTLNTTYGSNSDLWGADNISVDDLSSLAVTVSTGDVSGGDGVAKIQYIQVTVHWHVEFQTAPADVPIRMAYKVYSRDGKYLGELPNVTSPFAFSQDKDSAGSTIEIVCAEKGDNEVTVEPLLTDASEDILTDADDLILASLVDIKIATGASDIDAIFKNSNRVKAWMYNYWYPNGKLMFSGQINKLKISNNTTTVSVFSDGLDMSNFIARGYPFTYTADVTQNTQDGYVTVSQEVYGAWNRYGQTWIVGAGVTNLGALTLMLQGTATVTLTVYDGVYGNLVGSITKSVANAAATATQFEFSQLLPVTAGSDYFVAISVPAGQSIRVYRNSASATYVNGSMYWSSYAGGSGGGGYSEVAGDLYFITKYGTPTTTTTYSSQDPVTGMMSGILADYNARGGYITERDFTATGLSLTYMFNMAFIFDALKKVLELSPTGFYSYIDLGTAEIDINQMSTGPDFTVVKGKDVGSIDLVMSIEQVKNYMLFTGGDTGGGVNLYRQYQDPESNSFYGIRTGVRTDNRVTNTTTADAIGDTFIEDNANESQETSVTIPVTSMDTTLLTPGKTVGFKNYGDFIDNMVLQIVRREFNTKTVTLILGRLPVRMNDEIQSINRGLLNEQTIDNPSQPT